MSTNNLDTNQISEKLIAYLREELGNPEIDYVANLKQLQGGYETKIFRFRLRDAPVEFSQTLVLRLYPEFYGIQNAIWESNVQNVLTRVGYPVAKVHFLCTDMSILGGAFFIMDYIPGQLLISVEPETLPGILGKAHAELHMIDPASLVDELKEADIYEYGYGLDSRFDYLREKAQKMPWTRSGVDWLLDHRPPKPDRFSICHGDFHPLNILVDDGVITGVLDWAGFVIADPAFDIANTLVLITIPAKYLSLSWEGFPKVDWDLTAESYLAAYNKHKKIDPTNLTYYRVRRCLLGLIQGVEGQIVWQHPLIVKDLVHYIHEITGIQIKLPG